MNRIYRTLWSAATQSWQAVPETAKSAGKKSKSSAGGVIASVALGFSLNGVAHAQAPPAINQLPTGGTVARGTATISQTVTAQAAAMVVNQSSQRAVINWNTFNLGSAASINFVQSNAQSVTLNRVNDSNPSQIFGRITANGQVFLTNANGVYFSRTSSVDVGAFTATTHSITDDNFMSGRYVFDRNGATGKIVNEGNITAALGGYVALLAPEVQNAGVVVARAGMVALAAGEAITLSIDGSGSLAGITTTPSAIASLVENKLAVLAPDGQIILSAVALDKLQAGVVRNSGTLDANSLVNKGGKIVLEGDEIVMDRNSRIEAKGRTGGGVVLVGGDWQGSGTLRQATKVTMEAGATIDASATDNGDGGKVVLWSDIHNASSVTQANGNIKAEAGPNGGNGGQVETSGHQVDIAGAQVNAGADRGQGGNWLLDPYDYTITSTEATTIKGSLDTGTNFTVDTTNATSGNSTTIAGSSGTGNITVSSAIGKALGGAATLTLNAANNIVINAGISSTTGALSLNMTAGGSISGSNLGGLTLNGGTATFNQAADGSYVGVISGNSTSLIKSGAGTLTLQASNTYTGGNTINAGGTLKAGGVTALGTGANTVNSGAVLDLNGYTLGTAGGLTLYGTGISNGGALINSSATAASYSGLVTLGSDTTITGGAGKITLANAGTINLGYALTLDGSAGGTVSSKIASTGALNKQGTGTWILTGANTYSGTTTISAGNLQLGSTSVGSTTIGTGPIVNNATLTISAGPALNFAPNTISGTGQLIVGGSTAGSATYTFTLRSDNTYSGGTTINSGPRVVIGGGSTGAAGALTSGPFGTGTVTFGASGQVELAGYNIANTLKSISSAGSPSAAMTTAPTIYLSTGSSELSGQIDVTTASSGLVFAPASGSTLRLTGTLNSETTITANSNAKLGLVSAGNVVESFSSISGQYEIGLTSAAGKWTLASDAGNAIGLGTKAGALIYGGTFELAGNNLGSSTSSSFDGLNFTLSGGTLLNSANTPSTISTQYSYHKANSTISTPNVGGDIYWTGSSNLYGNAAVNTLTKTGLGDLHIQGSYLSAPNNVDFNIDVQAGNLSFDKGTGTTFSGTYSLAAGSTLYYRNPNSNIAFPGVITGAGAVVISPSATSGIIVTFSGANTYTGGTTVKQGATLIAGSSPVMSGSAIVSSAIGTGPLTLGDASTSTSGTYSMNATSILPNNVFINGPAGISSSGSPPATQTISGVIADGSNAGQSLTYYALGGGKTIEITGNNTYTGPTTISNNGIGGIVLISNANALGSDASGTTISQSAILKLKGGITVNEPISDNGGSGSIFGSLSGNNTFTGSYTNLSTGGNQIGSDAGTFTLSPTAGKTIDSGTTGIVFYGVGNIQVNGPIAGTSASTITIKSGTTGLITFAAVNPFGGPITINSGTKLVIGGSGSLGSGSYAGAITNNGTFQYSSSATQTLSGVMSGTGALINDGTGALTLSGVNTYTGTTTISNSSGQLIVAGAGKLGNGTYSATIANSGTFQFDSSAAQTLSGVISGAGQLIKSNTGTLTLSGANTYSGGSTLNGGILNVGSAGAMGSSGTISFGGGTLQFSSSNNNSAQDYSLRFSTAANQLYSLDTNSLSVALGGNLTSTGGSLTKLGLGTLTLNGTNTYSGNTTVSAGTLVIGSSSALGTSNTTVANLAALDLNGQTLATAGTLTLNGTGTTANTGALINGSATAASYGGLLTLGSISYIMANTGAINLTNTGTITGATFGLTLSGTAGGSMASILGTTTGSLTKSGTGTWTLTGANTYTGSTVISGGTLAIGGAGTLGGGTYAGTITNTATFKYDSSAAQTLSGVISGTAGALIDSGTGTLTLTAANIYTGTTTINTGSSLVVGSLTNTTATLGSGAITDNGKLLISRSGNLLLSGVIASATATGGSGDITVQATGTVNIDKTITMTGANSAIYVEAGANAAANNTTVSDVTLTNVITTSATGTVVIFAGAPTTTSTTTLSTKIASTGATGAIKYKTYNADISSLSTVVTGTRNFYYRINPTGTTASGITATKTYDGTTNALGYTSGGSVAGLSTDDSTASIGAVTSFAFTTADFSDPNAGSRTLTLGGASINTATWSVKGLSITTTGGGGTINKANLVLTGTKTYDGTTTVAGSQLTATGVHSESFALTGSVASGLSTADVQSNTTLSGVTGLTVGTSNGTNLGLASNYNVLSTTGSHFSVTPATATLTGTKTYDGTTTLTGSQLTITGVTVGGVAQTLGYSAGTASLSDANVATANNYVLSSGLVLTNGTGTASNYVLPANSYSSTYNRATVNALPIAVTLTAPSSTYTYDAQTTYASIASTLTAYTTNTSMANGDSIASLNYAVSNSGVAQAGNFSVTPSLNSLSAGAATTNYSFTFNPLTVSVAKAALTVSGTTVASKVYDRTTTATLSGGTLSGVLLTDQVTLTQAGTFASANAGTGIAVTANDTLSGASANNYALTQPTGLTADITPKALTVTGTTVASKTYDRTTTATLSGGSLSGVIAGDSVTLTQAGTFASANVGTGIAVTANDSINNSNYTLTQPTGLTGDITPKALTVTGTSVANKTYDRTTTATLSGGSLVGVIFGDSVTLTEAGTFASANAGTGIAVTANDSISGNSNYTLTQPTGLTANITAKALTVTGTTVANKVYDKTTTASLSGGSLSGVIAGDTVTLTEAGTFASANAGTGIAVTANDSINNSNYTLTQPTGLSADITPKALTVTGTSVASKTYDRTTTAALSGGSLVGVIAGDSVTLTQAGTFASANVGAGIAVTANDSINNSNYTLTQPSGLTADITAKALTVTGTSVANKTYDRTTTAALSGGSLVGVIAGDSVTLTEAGTFASANAGTGIAVTANDSINNSNYTLTQPTGLTANITPKALTVSGTTVASKTYSGTNTAALSGGSLTGVIAGDTVTLTEAGTFASANAGAGIAVTASDSLGGSSASNYALTQPTGLTGTINKANATVTANGSTVTYTGLAQSVSGFTASGLVNGETAAVLTGVSAGATGTNAGTYASVASGTDSNYNLTFVNGALTINKANATVTANGGTVTYTGLVQSVNGFTASGLVNGETAAVLTGVTAGATGTNAGSYTSTASGTAANYNLTFVNGALTINKANATVTANGGTVTYTGLAQSVSGFTASGLVNGETTAVLTGVSTTGGTGTNAGSYTHTASGTAANYNLSFVNGALTIGKANATVTANGGTTIYNGAAQSVSGFTATGLVNGETTAVLSGVTAGATGTNVGTYTSTASGTDSNYNLSFTNGTYTINKAPLSVSLTGQTKVYDGTTNATLANGSLTLTGFVSGQGATVTQTQASYNSANVLNATTVTASLAAGNYTANNGTLLSNYELPTTATGTGSITPARLSATGTKTYDGLVAFDATGLTVSGVNGETFAATGSGTMGSKNVQTNQALSSIAGLSLSGNNGALSSNYVALTTSDTQVSVTPRVVNLSAPAASKTYDSTTLYQASAADLTTLSNQLVGTDRVTAAEVVYANKDAGTGKRVSLNSVTINDDNGGNNYTVGKLDVTTGVINKAQLTVSVVSDARFVTQADTAGYAGVVYNGFVGGETASVVSAGSIARSNSGVNGAGQYTGVLQASGWQSGNYNISYNAGDYTIVGAHTLLVSVPTASTTYGTAATYVPVAKYLDSTNNTIVTLNPTMTGNALSVSDGAGGTASFAITAANATLSSSGNVQAGGYNLQASNVVKTGSNFQNLVMTGGLTVNPKVLNGNLGVQAITKVYDGSASISNLGLNFNQTLAGVTSGDTVSLVGSGSFDDRHVATNKTVNLSLGLLGADAANYALATPSFSTNTGAITQLASVTYTGASNGNWADFSNWAGGAMPDRNNVAQVVVPTGKTVVYNSDQVGTIGSTLAVDGAIRFTSSNAFTLANTVSGTGDLQQRGNGMLTVSGTNSNFSGNLDIGSYKATLNNAQALGAAGHVVSSGGQLSVASGVTLAALQVDGAMTVDTAIKTTSDQVYNGALTFLSSGTAQAPNFVSDTGNVDFMSRVSAGSGSMTAQRSLAVSAPNGSVLFNDQVGRSVRNLDFNTYLTTGLLDTSPYAMVVTAPTIKLFGDVTTFESQTYNGAMRVGSNGQNGHTRLLVSIDPSITFKSTVDDADPTGKVNGLDVRAISLAAITGNTPVPTITFEGNVGSTSPLASLRLAAGTQSTAAGALVTDIKIDDTSRRDTYYKGDIVIKGDVTIDNAPEMIAEQWLAPNGTPTFTWYTGTADFKLRLPVSGTTVTLPNNFHLNGPGYNNPNTPPTSNVTSQTANDDLAEAGRQWQMAYRTHERATQVASNDGAAKVMNDPTGRVVADVQVGNEATSLPTTTGATSPNVQAQTVSTGSSGAFVQVREFAPQTLQAQQAFVYQLPADTFVHSRENEYIKLSATLSNGANLPRWVKFSFKDRTFSGEAPKHVKSLDVKVTATDRQGKRASTRIRLVFTNGSAS